MKTQLIYGASDDLIEIDGSILDEISCYSSHHIKRTIITDMATMAKIYYTQKGTWQIDIISEGSDFIRKINKQENEDNRHDAPYNECPSYSDILILSDLNKNIRIGRTLFSK